MTIRSSVFESVGGFREDFGKVDDVARPEDTDPRTTFRYVARRCFHEGQGNAALDGARGGTAAERSYTKPAAIASTVVRVR